MIKSGAAKPKVPPLPEPLYLQIVATIKAQVRAGIRKPGEKLPATEILAAEFDVGKTTMKMALMLLEIDGVVIGQPGRGRYIASKDSRK